MIENAEVRTKKEVNDAMGAVKYTKLSVKYETLI